MSTEQLLEDNKERITILETQMAYMINQQENIINTEISGLNEVTGEIRSDIIEIKTQASQLEAQVRETSQGIKEIQSHTLFVLTNVDKHWLYGGIAAIFMAVAGYGIAGLTMIYNFSNKLGNMHLEQKLIQSEIQHVKTNIDRRLRPPSN